MPGKLCKKLARTYQNRLDVYNGRISIDRLSGYRDTGEIFSKSNAIAI